MYILLIIVIAFVVLTVAVLQLPVFGRVPGGARLYSLRQLPNYRDGALENLSYTPVKPDDVSYLTMLSGVIKGNKKSRPAHELPHVKPDFSATEETRLTWFGHSSYFLQTAGLNILVDPVFSSRTSPFSFFGSKNYKGTGFIEAKDFPKLDIVLITHDHYDHMDYQTILKLKSRTKHFVTSLGVGGHLERWGIPANHITELTWGQEHLINGLSFRSTTARHFSGRSFKRNQTLWSGFILQTPKHRLYLGGDSGYDTHFKSIGAEYGPFDLAILECGQYNVHWPLIHMFPEQTVQAAQDLNAKALLPVHWGKFTLATHDWNDSITRVVKKAREEGLAIATPMLGETFALDTPYPSKEWYKD